MSILPKHADYSDKDFDAIRLRLQKLVKSVYPDWTDFAVTNLGNLLLEMFAFVGDITSFYQDAQAAEAFLPTATQRKNILAICSRLGYRPPSGSAARAPVLITLEAPPIADVLIPAGTSIRTQDSRDPVEFQLLSGVTIEAGANPPVAVGTAEHSRSFTEQEIQVTGLPDFQHQISNIPYIDGSMVVFSGLTQYTEAPTGNFLHSGPTDNHFVVVVDQNERATVRFGNGINGRIPTEQLTISYAVGGGLRGNVEVNSLTKIDGQFFDAYGNRVRAAITNPGKAQGGADRLTSAQIKQLAPESLRTVKNSVAREDFEINARRLPGVERALMLTSNEMPEIEENAGILFVVPADGGVPTATFKQQVLDFIKADYPPTLTFRLSVQDPLFRQINIRTVVFPQSNSTTAKLAMKADIVEALRAYFAIHQADGTQNPNVRFGFEYKDSAGIANGEIPYTDVLNVIRDVTRVRKLADGGEGLRINGRPESVVLFMHEFPILGEITVIDGLTGTAI